MTHIDKTLRQIKAKLDEVLTEYSATDTQIIATIHNDSEFFGSLKYFQMQAKKTELGTAHTKLTNALVAIEQYLKYGGPRHDTSSRLLVRSEPPPLAPQGTRRERERLPRANTMEGGRRRKNSRTPTHLHDEEETRTYNSILETPGPPGPS